MIDKSNGNTSSGQTDGPDVAMTSHISLPTLNDLLTMPASQLARLDLAFRNLLCATGLPDTNDLDIHACLGTLHGWVDHVKRETDRNLYRFRRAPSEFGNSEGYWRTAMMITILQQDCGVRYDEEARNSNEFLDSSQAFIHGLLMGKGGTCTNMPVLYAAVGRWLGYPIYLVCAKGHFFCRWSSHDGSETFNIEGTNQGINVFPDEHYMNWPATITPQEVEHGFYLRNLSAMQELAHFMTVRGHCLQDRKFLPEALVAYAQAHRLSPSEPHHFAMLTTLALEELRLHAQGLVQTGYRDWQNFGEICGLANPHWLAANLA